MSFEPTTFLKGAAMGVAEVIPGVSGGTIAFITGIYERLINLIKAFGPEMLMAFRKGGVSGLLKLIDFVFLVSLMSGMLLGIILGVFTVTHLLATYPLLVWSFFFGLIFISAWHVGRQIEHWDGALVFILTIGAAAAFMITTAIPANGKTAPWFVFVSGTVAVCALLLPGISGSFVLLLMGMYNFIMESLKTLLSNPSLESAITVLIFGAGMIVGLASFSRFISWTFKHHKNVTLAALTGFLVGSLNKVWPWQEVMQTRINSKGDEVVLFTRSVMPNTFEGLSNNFQYGNDPQLALCLLLMAAGVVSVLALERFANRLGS